MRAIMHCRTAALGGHVDVCPRCGGDRAISYNSCRNRHCPKCQSQARQRWIAARKQELLATRYFHVVFTLPHELHALVLQNEAELYNLLFRTVAVTLLEIARDPKHLGAEIGFFGILHTWGQNLLFHPHIHCVIPGGGIAPDHSPLDSSAVSILLTCESPRKSVPWKIRRRTASGFSEGTSEACRDNPTSQRTKGVCGIPANLVPATLGCLREASLRRTRAGCALSRTLYAPHRDLQSPIDCIRWRSRHIPLEGLRAGQQTTADDGVRRRVHSAISGARSAKRIRSYPSFRFHGECTPVCIAGTVSTIVEHGAGDLFDRCCVRPFRLVLSQLSWTYDCRGTIYGSPVDVEICFGMFFRYFVACNPNLFCFVVLWHIYADVCPLSLVTQSLVHGSSRFHAKHQLKRVHIIRRDRLLGLDVLHLVSTSTRIPVVSP